jgi:acetoacetate decarboxylase
MGRLTKDKFGFSMPVSENASLYTRHPFYYRNVRRLAIVYETELNPVLDILPEFIEPSTDPPQVVVSVTDVGFHVPLGPYAESYVAVRCKFKNEPIRYIAFMWVNSDAAMAAGREIYGAPKKMGKVTLGIVPPSTELMQGIVERPEGNNILTISAHLTGIAEPGEMKGEPAALLRVIPDSCGAKEPAIAELLRIDSTYEIETAADGHKELYKGIGSISFGSRLQTDPVHELESRKILSTFFMKMNIREEKVTRLHRY